MGCIVNDKKVSIVIPVYNVADYLDECLESVVTQYLTTVKPMYHHFVSKTKRYADIIIPNDFSHSVATDLLIEKIKSILKK